MAQVRRQPSTFCFSSLMGDIAFWSSAEKGALTVTLTCGGTAMTALSETLWTDSAGLVTVGSLSELVEPYAREYGRITMDCSFDDGTEVAAIDTVTILYCMADVGMTAQQWVDSHFLTVLNGEKITYMGCEERLSAYGVETVTIAADVVSPTGEYSTMTATLAATDTADGISIFNVSPGRVAQAVGLDIGRLLAYTVTAGERSQQFRVREARVVPEPSLLFANSFGCEEFLHCRGTLKREGKFTRAAVRIGGMRRNYKAEEERTFTANTGWLSDPMAEWAEELLRSLRVWLWVNGARSKEITITESKSEVLNDDDYLAAYELTYTYAQRIHNVLPSPVSTRIFSEQFENIYA